MRGIIRVGDLTSHGGRVETGAPASSVMGRAVARKGDHCSCPVPGHQDCTIAEGDAAFIVAGQPAAFDGHKTSCGAVLISSVPESGRS
ncbi:PAAR domain-containing protein [Ralstonia pseudosolanacearum]|uniref:PAAR domain-containing protein n=1 Tax=Ralstonia pseudosolanacearum TaxID=1310165 RepID=UPI00048BF3A8|nr:PAAR domain-containing protein [Ralstonia pseudosolanacearum]MCL1620868.1 PAAR domain-containing protein [Ralstonia pseudosolanacearum CaRs-Mep]